MINANLTIYAGWKLRVIHIVAKMLGVLVKVDGIPYGCNKAHIRHWYKDAVQCSFSCRQVMKTRDTEKRCGCEVIGYADDPVFLDELKRHGLNIVKDANGGQCLTGGREGVKEE